MAAKNDMEAVRAQVKRQLPSVLKKSKEELLADVGQITLSSTLFDPQSKTTAYMLTEAGNKALRSTSINARVKATVCNPDNRDLIKDTLTVSNVTALVSLLLSAFGIAGVVPSAVLSLAVLILKMGLNQYCSGFKAAKV